MAQRIRVFGFVEAVDVEFEPTRWQAGGGQQLQDIVGAVGALQFAPRPRCRALQRDEVLTGASQPTPSGRCC